MYEKIEGGTVVNVQGLDCWVPPVGYVFNLISKKIEYRGVYSRSNVQEDQYWERFGPPVWYGEVLKRWNKYDKDRKEGDPEFYDARLDEYKKQEWDRRLNGFWFMNNGVPTYLTGTHYFFLEHWHIDIGSPKFRIPDLEKAYFMQYCIEDPSSMGMVEVTKRRFGKSFWAGVFVTEYTTRTKMANGGIQSKTGPDAKKFFSKAVVKPFRRLPKFFRPEYDMSLGVNPKSEIRFEKTNVRGKKAEDGVDKDELGSMIDWGSADTVHYDGQKIHRYVGDEVGKTVEANVFDRHEVVRYCLLDDEGNIIGKALYTTTVEKIASDKDGVQEAFIDLWDASNQNVRDEAGRTESGLYRFFMPADRTRNFDLYGYPDVEKTREKILSERRALKGRPRSLAARIRKEPLTIDEAFMADTDKCIFNIVNIAKRENELREKPVYARSVWFYRDLNGVAKMRDATEEEEDFHWKITGGIPDEKDQNTFSYDGAVKVPGRQDIGVISVDGYSNSQGGDKYGSSASAWIGLKYRLEDPNNTGKAIGHLWGRPAVKTTLHQQVMLAAEFFGFMVYYEHNADDYYTYFLERGMVGYLGRYPLCLIAPEKREDAERHRGVPTTIFSLTKQNDDGVAYFEAHCDKIDFMVLLIDAKKYDPNNRTKYDVTVSFLILVVLLFDRPPQRKPRAMPLVEVYDN